MKLCKKVYENEYFVLFAYAVLVAICSFGSSPLINNEGCDGYVFITMGRAMASGKVLYKDIFDLKGWYLFFFYAIAALISEKSLWGLFIIELIFFLIELWMKYRMMALLSMTSKQALLATMFMTILEMQFHICSKRSTTESFVLVFQYTTLYILTKYFVKKKNNQNYFHPAKYMFIYGICAGVAFGIKANWMLMWCPIPVIIAYSLLKGKRYRTLLHNMIGGILGVIVAWTPMAIYAIVTDSIQDMLFGMIGSGLKYSSDNEGFWAAINTILNSQTMLMIFGILVLSVIVVVRTRDFNIQAKILYLLMTVFSVIAFAIGGRVYSHYLLYVVPMCIPAVISVCNSKYCVKILERCHAYVLAVGCLIVFLLFNRSLIYSLSDSSSKMANDEIKTVIYENMCDIDIKDASVLATGINAQYYVDLNVIPKRKVFFYACN